MNKESNDNNENVNDNINDNDNNNTNKAYLMNKRFRNKKLIPFKLKQNFTVRLLKECFSNDIVLVSKLPRKKDERNFLTHPPNAPISKKEEIHDLLNEISEIESELELFAMENRKRRMIKLIEKMSEYIDEDTIDIEQMTNEFFFG